MLAIDRPPDFDNAITGKEYHSHKPYGVNAFAPNDEIRISIAQSDIFTTPFESTLHITGTVEGKKADGTAGKFQLVNNAIAFMFDDIRYEIGGTEIDRVKNVGITSTMKNLLSVQMGELSYLKNGCWLGAGSTMASGENGKIEFSFIVPLKMLMGFAEDYKRIIVHARQELILLRSATDTNAVLGLADGATGATVTITNLYWRVPHVTVTDAYRHKMLKMVSNDAKILVPFRSWELHEYPELPTSNRHSWTVRTSTSMETPRYAVLAFQKSRRNKIDQDMARFDACDVTNVKLYLNSKYYPYNNINGDQSVFYEMFSNFQNSYYGRSSLLTAIDKATFESTCPLYVIDCSKQEESVKPGPVDIRIEWESKNNFTAETAAYVLLIHDCVMSYTLLTNTVRKS